MGLKKASKGMCIRYFQNRKIKVGKYSLSVTSRGTVYWLSDRGNRKLDSMIVEGNLEVVLPNNKTITIDQDEKGSLRLFNKEND